jgi:hypothetical protein
VCEPDEVDEDDDGADAKGINGATCQIALEIFLELPFQSSLNDLH